MTSIGTAFIEPAWRFTITSYPQRNLSPLSLSRSFHKCHVQIKLQNRKQNKTTNYYPSINKTKIHKYVCAFLLQTIFSAFINCKQNNIDETMFTLLV